MASGGGLSKYVIRGTSIFGSHTSVYGCGRLGNLKLDHTQRPAVSRAILTRTVFTHQLVHCIPSQPILLYRHPECALHRHPARLPRRHPHLRRVATQLVHRVSPRHSSCMHTTPNSRITGNLNNAIRSSCTVLTHDNTWNTKTRQLNKLVCRRIIE